jgi:hypothetical protein
MDRFEEIKERAKYNYDTDIEDRDWMIAEISKKNINDWTQYHADTESTLKSMRDCLKDREHIIEQLIADNVEL